MKTTPYLLTFLIKGAKKGKQGRSEINPEISKVESREPNQNPTDLRKIGIESMLVQIGWINTIMEMSTGTYITTMTMEEVCMDETLKSTGN